MENLVYWVWMSLLFGEKYALTDRLLSQYKTPEAVYALDEEELFEITKKHDPSIKELSEAESVIGYCNRNGIGIIPLGSPCYPPSLKRIKDRPIVLYYRGRLPDFEKNLCVAVVGTRKMSSYGERYAYTISYDLGKSGAVVVSGMALGVDSTAHRGALDAGAMTVAVMGCGVDIAYPSSNRELMKEIVEKGAVVSEYPPQALPLGYRFPKRNRIISALSRCTFVVEADNRSGAMITARDAGIQGKDIFAMPGMLGEANSKGTNLLIKEGARAVTSAEDIIGEYCEEYSNLNMDYLRNSFRDSVIFGAVPSDASVKPSTERIPSVGKEPKAERDEDKAEKNDRIISPKQAKPTVEINGKTVKSRKTEIINASKPEKNPAFDGLNENQKKLYLAIPEQGEINIDALSGICSMSVNAVLANITMLEIKGLAERVAGGLIKRK